MHGIDRRRRVYVVVRHRSPAYGRAEHHGHVHALAHPHVVDPALEVVRLRGKQRPLRDVLGMAGKTGRGEQGE